MQFLLSLVFILVGAKCFGALARRFSIPPILGELVAGILLGPSILSWVRPEAGLQFLAEAGVILLLFELGLESDFMKFMSAGTPALKVAVVGFTLPLILAFLFSYFVFSLYSMASLFIAGALTATSIAITARVLADLKKRHTHEAHIVIAAAVFDDILGMLLLGLFCFLAESGDVSHIISTLLIVCAFAVGLVLSRHAVIKEKIARRLSWPIKILPPIFFVMIGVSINLRTVPWHSVLVWKLFAGLLLVALIGKFIAGFVVKEPRSLQTIIGMSMIPRGEVGLIFAQLGLQSLILNNLEYTVLILVVMVTTLLAPFLLRWRYKLMD